MDPERAWLASDRKKVVVGPVEARWKELAEQEVPLAKIATQYGFEILAVEVMPRHTCRPSRKLKQAFADAKHPYCLRRQDWGELGMHATTTLWAEGD